MVDLKATSSLAPLSVRRLRAKIERQKVRVNKEVAIFDAWREDEAERNMNGIPPITLKDFTRRYKS